MCVCVCVCVSYGILVSMSIINPAFSISFSSMSKL